MSGGSTTFYNRGDYARVCDVCGHMYMRSQLKAIGYGQLACPDDYPGIHAKQQAELAKRSKPLVFKLHKNLRGTVERPDYQETEALIFNFLLDTAPYVSRDMRSGMGAVSTTTSLEGAAESVRYFYDLITENKRPTSWIRDARAKVVTLADWLVSIQDTTIASLLYGSFGSEINRYSHEVGGAGLALLYAYRLTSDFRYLTAARRCATFLRRMQLGGYRTAGFSSTDAAGAVAYNAGMWTYRVVDIPGMPGNPFYDHTYWPGGLIGAEFLAALAATDGDRTCGDVALAPDLGAGATDATYSACVAQALAFWTNGIAGVGDTGPKTGLSATTPFSWFNSYPAWKTVAMGTHKWELEGGDSIITEDWALALRSLYAIEGYSTRVRAIYEWLLTFTSTAGAGYDPTMAPALRLLPGAKTNATGAYALYDWKSAGMLAAIQGHATNANMVTSRARLAKPMLRDDAKYVEAVTFDPKLSGQSTFAYEAPTSLYYYTAAAACAGSFYRQSPMLFPMQA